jgi:hypothetical protein
MNPAVSAAASSLLLIRIAPLPDTSVYIDEKHKSKDSLIALR